ncbi:MAG: SCP2 sterol-binding domain-containing protein [Proteobacteria bacterium]|nr:SCP2 sterol-binding domain-containing protein [Pseudomonadota bacterium]
MTTPTLLKPLQGLFNRRLADSSQARALCRQLDGKTLAMQLAPEAQSGLAIFLSVADEQISVHADFDAEPDVIVASGLSGLLDLATDNSEQAIRAGRVKFFGDADIAQAFQQLLQLTRPDWEEELSRLTGDAAARQIGNLFRSGLAFGKKIFSTVSSNAAEFLQEESRDLPSQPEVAKWMSDIDKLREDSDRLEAKIRLLERNGDADA